MPKNIPLAVKYKDNNYEEYFYSKNEFIRDKRLSKYNFYKTFNNQKKIDTLHNENYLYFFKYGDYEIREITQEEFKNKPKRRLFFYHLGLFNIVFKKLDNFIEFINPLKTIRYFRDENGYCTYLFNDFIVKEVDYKEFMEENQESISKLADRKEYFKEIINTSMITNTHYTYYFPLYYQTLPYEIAKKSFRDEHVWSESFFVAYNINSDIIDINYSKNNNFYKLAFTIRQLNNTGSLTIRQAGIYIRAASNLLKIIEYTKFNLFLGSMNLEYIYIIEKNRILGLLAEIKRELIVDKPKNEKNQDEEEKEENLLGSDAPTESKKLPSGKTRWHYLGFIRKNYQKSGGIFPYFNTSPINLKLYQIFENKSQIEEDPLNSIHCLLYALMKNKIDITVYNFAKLPINIPLKIVRKVAKELNLRIKLSYFTRKNKLVTRYYGPKDGKKVILALYKNHYFINNTTPFTLWFARNFDKFENLRQVPPNATGYRKNSNGTITFISNKNAKKIDALHLIKILDEKKYFKLNQTYLSVPKEIKFYKNDEILKINWKVQKENSLKIYSFKKIIKNFYLIMVADFEASINEKYHVPYMISFQKIGFMINNDNEEQTITLKGEETITIYGENCAEEFLRRITNITSKYNHVIIYFHNLKYDATFIFSVANKVNLTISKQITLDSKIYEIVLYSKWTKGKIILRDSYKIIPFAIKSFKIIFDLKINEFKKEYMPYKFYNSNTVQKDLVKIEEVAKAENIKKEEILKLIDQSFIVNKNNEILFKSKEYAKFYCERDVKILGEGLKKFLFMVNKSTKLNIFKFLSISSLANEYMIKRKVYSDVYYLCGAVREFVQQSIIGGRVATRMNKKWDLKGEIVDFDAVSLYPSAMKRIGEEYGYPTGFPEILLPKDKDKFEKIKNTPKVWYIVEIKDIKINRRLPMPIFNYKNNKGIRKYTNIPLPPEESIIIDRITLEDYEKYHKITYKFVKGFYWPSPENYNKKIKNVIVHLFNERLKHKKEKNPIQLVYKLMMNSAYGKTIIKFREKRKILFINQKKLEDHLKSNLYKLTGIENVNNTYIIKELNDVWKHKNAAHIGGMILSMSKRIMNEVMIDAAIGEKYSPETEIPIFYQDTDSMHLYKKDLPELAKRYKKLFNRELIGTSLGQFHNDFPEDTYSKRCIILGKKCYLDVLSNGKYHIRMKGIPLKEIYGYCEEKNITVEQLYEKLYAGEEITFTLGKYSPLFTYKGFDKVTTNERIERKIKF